MSVLRSITKINGKNLKINKEMVQNIQRYISQLGMMVIAVGLSSYNVALFHLVNHAFYKGLLFLGAGAVIHALADNQDFRKYGGLISFLPLTYSVMLIASLSLVAFPFMTGFYSKDFILESAYGQFHLSSVAVYFIATIGAMFTTLYSVKVLYLTFLTNANGPLINYKRAHEGDVFMSLPLIILAVFSIFFGYITKDMFIGMASGFFSDNSLFTHPLHEIMLETEFAVPTLFKLLPFFLTVTLSALSLTLSEFLCKSLIYFKLTRMGYNIFSFFNQRLLIELFYNKYITCFILNLGGQTTKVLDKGSIELLGPYGLEKGLLRLSKSLSSLDTGVITSYALFILIGLILYILIPYISLIEISILLCIISGLLSIAVNMFSLSIWNNIQQPHLSVSLLIQSNLFRFLVGKLNLNRMLRKPTNSSRPDFSIFNFKGIPPHFERIVLKGKDAVNFISLRNTLEKELGDRVFNKVKIKLVFGIIDDNWTGLIAKHHGSVSSKYARDYLFSAVFKRFTRNEEGIEFIFSPSAVYALVNMIEGAISYQSKVPENVHICIIFWDSDGLNGIVNYNDDATFNKHASQHIKADDSKARSCNFVDHVISLWPTPRRWPAYDSYLFSSKYNNVIGKRFYSVHPYYNYFESGPWSLFQFKCIPDHSYYLFLPGFEAINPAILKDKLENILVGASFASNKKAKIRLVFGVIHVSPREINRCLLDQASYTDRSNSITKLLQENVCLEDVGIEFIFSPEVVQALAKVINIVVLYQGKIPQNVHIIIDFWALEDDDCNNDDDDDDH